MSIVPALIVKSPLQLRIAISPFEVFPEKLSKAVPDIVIDE